jgi:hypothetical protein
VDESRSREGLSKPKGQTENNLEVALQVTLPFVKKQYEQAGPRVALTRITSL